MKFWSLVVFLWILGCLGALNIVQKASMLVNIMKGNT